MATKSAPFYDPSTFPAFEFGHVLPPKFTPAKVSDPDLRGCLAAAIYLASQIELAHGSIHLRVEPIRSVYFRASLAELIRVEDIAMAAGKKFKFNEGHDPLLHIVKLLRNYQVHVGVIGLQTGAVEVVHGGESGIYETFIVDNLSVKKIRKLDSAKRYTDRQLEELLKLFDIHQRKFGVTQLLYNTCLHVGMLVEKT